MSPQSDQPIQGLRRYRVGKCPGSQELDNPAPDTRVDTAGRAGQQRTIIVEDCTSCVFRFAPRLSRY